MKGLCKFHYEAGTDHRSIAAFAREGELITDYESILTKEPSQLRIEALEDMIVATIPQATFDTLADTHPTIARLRRAAIDKLLLHLVRRERQLLTLTAAERYRTFCEEFRPVLGRISEQDKAAYIGVTPVSLSRLTARLRKMQQIRDR